MICRRIYETRIHGLCGTTAPGVMINCEHSQTKCSLDCSSQCTGYEEGGSTQKPTEAQKKHNQEFIEYVANTPVRKEPIVPSKVLPISPVIVQNKTKNITPPTDKVFQHSGCGCGGNTAGSNYTATSAASYIR